MRDRPFVPALTGIRFVAALMVLIGHGAGILPQGMPGSKVAYFIEQDASIGMSLFFALSGVVIWINYAAMFRDRPFGEAFRGFAIARFARLYPMYLCAILLALGVAGVHAPLHRLPWSGLFFLMVQSWVPGAHGMMAAASIDWAEHLWSVSTEILFYILFPAVVAVIWGLRSRTQLIGAMIANLLAYSALFYMAFRYGPALLNRLSPTLGNDGMPWLTYYAPYLHIPEFIAGCLVGSAFLKFRERPVESWENKLAIPGAILLVIGFIALPLFLSLIRYAPAWGFRLAFITRVGSLVLFPLALLHITRYETFLSRILSNPLMLLGGEASYSIYLLHPFLIDRFNFHPGDTYAPAPGEFFFRLTLLVCMVTIFSWGSYTLIERPARAWLRRALGNFGRRKVAVAMVETGTPSD